jgi:hypothetical protein
MFERILRSHLIRYPAIQIQDVYKLIHQATLGSEHAISNPESAYAWLERELSEMGDGMDEPVADPISADGEIVRVHLRPFLATGKSHKILFDAFLRTAKEYQGKLSTLEQYWKIAVSMGHFPVVDMDEFIQRIKAQEYPAAHHSDEYKKLYRPAYRVVWKKIFSFEELSA